MEYKNDDASESYAKARIIGIINVISNVITTISKTDIILFFKIFYIHL
jgi:hypothetical protein